MHPAKRRLHHGCALRLLPHFLLCGQIPQLHPSGGSAAEHHGDRKGQIRAVCELCDRQIFGAYRIYPINCVAYDRLLGVSRFAGRCTAEERHTAEDYLDSRLAMIEMPGRDEPFLRRKLLEMYANPLINKLSVTGDV